jgi:hypothetical protein
VRAALLSIACVAGLSVTASEASAADFSISLYRPAPVVVVRSAPVYYTPPVTIYPSYYPSYYPIYVTPRPSYGWGNWSNYPVYPAHGHDHHHHHR